MFRYNLRFEIDKDSLGNTRITIRARDKNRPNDPEKGYVTQMALHDIKFLDDVLEAGMNEMLHKIATDNANLHYESDTPEYEMKLARRMFGYES